MPNLMIDSQERPTSRIDGERKTQGFKADPEAIKRRVSYLETDASAYRDHCQEIVNYIVPFRADITSKQQAGVKKMQFINDSTGTLALNFFGAGVSAKMCNAAIPWFDLKTQDDYLDGNKDCRLWLDRVKRLFMNVFNRSNFYTADRVATIDDGAFGTAPMFVGEHPRWGCYYEPLSIGEIFVALDPYGQVDTVFRRYDLTARQIQTKWPETCSGEIKSHTDRSNSPDQTFTLIHAVQPRTDRNPRKADKLNMAWESVYMELNTNKILQEGGFREFPYVISRYDVASGEIYGRGPGMIALPDIKELQIRKRDTTKAGQLRLAPPAILANEGFAGVPIKRTPWGFTFANLDAGKKMQDMVASFPIPGDLGWSDSEMEQMRTQIKAVFFYDLMLMAIQKEVTLGEFMELAQEKMQLLGPYVGRLQTERYNPLFDRTFNLLWDQGKILTYCGPPPRELIGPDGELKYKVEYVSPLAKAQKMAEVQGVVKAVGFIGQGAAIKPEIVDILDWDNATRMVLESGGVPSKFILSADEVKPIRDARAKQKAEEKQQQQMMEMAGKIPALSKEAGKGSVMDGLNQALRQGAGTGTGGAGNV